MARKKPLEFTTITISRFTKDRLFTLAKTCFDYGLSYDDIINQALDMIESLIKKKFKGKS